MEMSLNQNRTLYLFRCTLDQFLSGEIIASNILYKSSNKLKFLYRNAGKFNLETKKLLISALIQCHFDYTCSAWYNGLSKKLKCRMQCTQNKIIRFMLNAPCRFHVGANEFKHVGLLPIEYRVEQLYYAGPHVQYYQW